MKLYDELYFEITLKGQKSELVKFIRFLNSGELNDYFDIEEDYICPADGFAKADDEEKSEITFTNDDIGIEITRFDPEDFLDVFCLAAKKLDVRGHFYDINDEEYEFSSPLGDNGYTDSILSEFNDELDSYARDEEVDDEDEE